MDKEALVDKDFAIGNDVIGLIAAAGIPLEDAFWVHYPQMDEWWLMLLSPTVDRLGIHDAYLAFSKAVHGSPLFDEIPLQRISLLSPRDNLVEGIARFEKHPYGGALHVVRFDQDKKPPVFRVTFAPYTRGAQPMISFDNEAGLVRFLHEHVGIEEFEVDIALRQLKKRQTYSFPDVHLTTAQLRQLGLLPEVRRSHRK